MIRTQNYKRELLFIFFTQKGKIQAVFLGFLMLSFLVAFFWPPTYGAYGSILLKGKKIEKNPEALEESQLRPMPVTKEDLYSEIAILTSNEVLQRTIETLKKEGEKEVVEKLGSSPGKQVQKLRSSLTAEPTPTSNVINITFSSKNPKSALRILEILLDRYVDYRQEVYNPKNVTTFLSGQLRRYQENLNSKNQELIKLVEKSGATAPDLQIQHNLLVKKEISSQLALAESQAIELRHVVANLDKRLSREEPQFFASIDAPGLIELRNKVQTLYTEYESLLRRYTPESQAVLLKESEVEQVFQTLIREVSAYRDQQANHLASLEEQIVRLKEQLQKIDQENMDLKKGQIALNSMEQDLKLLGFSYETFFKRSQEASVQDDPEAGRTDSYVSILVRPTAMDSPIFPKPGLLIPFGIVTGLILAITIGFLYEYLDHTFKRPEDLENFGGLPLIFSIPLHIPPELLAKTKSKGWFRYLPGDKAPRALALALLATGLASLFSVTVRHEEDLPILSQTRRPAPTLTPQPPMPELSLPVLAENHGNLPFMPLAPSSLQLVVTHTPPLEANPPIPEQQPEGVIPPMVAKEETPSQDLFYYLHLGSFAKSDSLDRVRHQVEEAGMTVTLETIHKEGHTMTRILAGPFTDKTRAQETLQNWQTLTGNPGRLLRRHAMIASPSLPQMVAGLETK